MERFQITKTAALLIVFSEEEKVQDLLAVREKGADLLHCELEDTAVEC